MDTEKRPRQYAAEIAQLSSITLRREALQLVPDEWRELVKTHLRIAFEWKRFYERTNPQRPL